MIPSALRKGQLIWKTPLDYCSEGLVRDPEQINIEIFALSEFVRLADRVGLELPPYDEKLRSVHSYSDGIEVLSGRFSGREQFISNWPQHEYRQVLALAQHHGIPTRLLDFSFDPLVAVFFPALQALHYEDMWLEQEQWQNSGARFEIAVWEIRGLHLSRHSTIQTVEASRSTNSFLAAQKGLFLLKTKKEFDEEQEDPATEVSFYKDQRSYGKIIKYTLSAEHSGDLLMRIEAQRIDFAHLKPSFDNVVKHLRRSHSKKAFLYMDDPAADESGST